MLKIVDDEWLVDTDALLCSNNLTNIIVGFVKSGDTYISKIKDMPMELTVRLTEMKGRENLLQKAILDAEKILLKKMVEKNEERK